MAVSISALQRNAAAVIRRVLASGQAEQITDRGEVVAILGPPPAATGLDRLRAAGLTHPPTSTWAELLPLLDALPPIDGLRAALDEQRRDR